MSNSTRTGDIGQALGRFLAGNGRTASTADLTNKAGALAALVFTPSPRSFDAVKDAFQD